MVRVRRLFYANAAMPARLVSDHGWAETPWNVDLDVMADAVAELDTVLAQVAGVSAQNHSFSAVASCDSQSVESAVAFDDAHVVSGATFKDHATNITVQLWRVTFRSQPNRGSATDHPNNVKILSVEPFTYWPSGVGEWFALEPVPGARCVFRDCAQTHASSGFGVWLAR